MGHVFSAKPKEEYLLVNGVQFPLRLVAAGDSYTPSYKFDVQIVAKSKHASYHV